MVALYDIERTLGGLEPKLLAGDHGTNAAVALLLREEKSGLQMLFIERATHAPDPWSGNLGFPGGKVEKGDGDAKTTAERETLEEIGLDLRRARCIGRLSDITGAHLPIRISCFVYSVGLTGPLSFSEEVSDAFWVPLDELFDPVRHGEFTVQFDGQTLIRPAIKLSQPDKPLLWGITYRLVMQFRDILRTIDNDYIYEHSFPDREGL